MSCAKGLEPADIVLLYPKTGLDVGGHTVAPPHSLLAIAAPVYKTGYRVKIIDMRRDWQWRKTLKESVSKETICVGVSTMTGTQLYFALIMAQEARRLTAEWGTPIIWGGPHPSIVPEQALRHELVDIVVIGEGDQTFPELVGALKNKQPLEEVPGLALKNGRQVIKTAARPLLDMNKLLSVPWEIINVEDYISSDKYFLKNSPRTLDIGSTSRGCPHGCGFCLSSGIWQRHWRPMTVERSLEVILEPVKKFNLTGVWIRDDEFYADNSRAFEICDRLLSSKHNISWYATGSRVDDFNRATDEQLELLKRSGGRITKFGIESGSNRILDFINKGFHTEDTIKANLRCKQHGIIPAYSLIVGFPTESFREIEETIDFGFRLQKDYPAAQLETIAAYTAFPGTPLWDTAVAHGLRPPEKLEGWVDWVMDDYDLEGRRLPWFSRKERVWIGNINYMSILANSIKNVTAGIKNRLLRALFLSGPVPLQRWYRLRLKKKFYKIAPELVIARFMRKKLFYRNERNFW
jgi:anaerobic magnesium-protoporphyrin IX monomethyl ester cyclase